jgi:hypothetical protein
LKVWERLAFGELYPRAEDCGCEPLRSASLKVWERLAFGELYPRAEDCGCEPLRSASLKPCERLALPPAGELNECQPCAPPAFPRFAIAAFEEGRSNDPRLLETPSLRDPLKPAPPRFAPANPERWAEKKRCEPAAPPRIVAGLAERPLGL